MGRPMGRTGRTSGRTGRTSFSTAACWAIFYQPVHEDFLETGTNNRRWLGKQRINVKALRGAYWLGHLRNTGVRHQPGVQLGLHVKSVPVSHEKLHKRYGGEPFYARDRGASAVRSAASTESGAERLDTATSSANVLFVKAVLN